MTHPLGSVWWSWRRGWRSSPGDFGAERGPDRDAAGGGDQRRALKRCDLKLVRGDGQATPRSSRHPALLTVTMGNSCATSCWAWASSRRRSRPAGEGAKASGSRGAGSNRRRRRVGARAGAAAREDIDRQGLCHPCPAREGERLRAERNARSRWRARGAGEAGGVPAGQGAQPAGRDRPPFPVRRQIKLLLVNQEQLRALNAGELGGQINSRYCLVTAADLAAEIFPKDRAQVDPCAGGRRRLRRPEIPVPDDCW